MDRRQFVASAATGAATIGLAAPAIADPTPDITWRMPSSFPRSLPTLFGGAEYLAARVAAITDNRFQIRPFAGGEIVPSLAVLDAVQNGTVEIGHTTPFYYVGKDPSFAFGSTVPFGFNARQQQAWIFDGGGLDLMNELLKGYNAIGIPAGNTGAQMGGWFRREIRNSDDIKGLKFRIGGLGGQVIARMGGVPQQIVGGDIYPALENGTIDAAEWVGPYDDETLGFYKIAKYYYYPGWWEGNSMSWSFVNLDKWRDLPPSYQAALQAACCETTVWMQSKYDSLNPPALRRLVANGTELRMFSREIMQAAYKASFEVYDDMAAKNPMFAKMYASWKAFREGEYVWFRVAEASFDNFVYTHSAARPNR
jgi:TRAP-type mannitol/chloroaromatic compound transport system substrate-binding protein